MFSNKYEFQLESIDYTHARETIYFFIRWGEHRYDYLRALPDEHIERQLPNLGLSLTEMIKQLQQNPHHAIPHFENLADNSTFEITALGNAKVHVSTFADGVRLQEAEVNDVTFIRQAYLAHFASACNARDLAIKNCDFEQFYTATSKGISSVDAFLELKATIHNSKHGPDAQIPLKRGRFPLENKITEWLPKMTGFTINTDDPFFKDFRWLKKIRNDVEAHPKPSAAFTSLSQLEEGINRFRHGIGTTMFVLHQAFQQEVPGNMIRAMMHPNVRLAKTKSIDG